MSDVAALPLREAAAAGGPSQPSDAEVGSKSSSQLRAHFLLVRYHAASLALAQLRARINALVQVVDLTTTSSKNIREKLEQEFKVQLISCRSLLTLISTAFRLI
jgi:hypothetical protein